MSEAEIWICPQCQTSVDISEQGFMAKIMCPGCGMENTVHTVLHNFRLERVLGVGGMSIVLQARDLVLNRPLAIKLLKDSYRSDPERVSRFEKECSLMAKVRHPNVVSVYSAGAANGQFYIAMELVEGTNLELMVSATQPMAPLKALSIVRQVAKGLNAANKAGLLHRDIKPGNVLVTRTGRAKVLDFGLSLGKADADTEETIWATPFYVPPETLRRESEDVRTDIYALGMTLRFLLSGCETFASMPQTPEELLECKRHLQPILSRDYRIDETYADLVNHMTAYDINARPTGYIDLLQELEEVYEAQREYEVAHSPAGRAKHRIRRMVYSVCVLVLGLLTMWLTSIVCTPSQEYDAIVFSEQDKIIQNDARLLKEAEAALEKQQWSESAAKFMLLYNKASDPAMGAWGGLVAVYLAELGVADIKSVVEIDMKCFTADTSNSPAGRDGMNKMRAIWQALRDDKAALPVSDKTGGEEVWKAFFHLSKLFYFAHKGNKVEMQIQQEKAIEFFELSNAPYSQLALVLKKWDNASTLKIQFSQEKETQILTDSRETSDQYYTISSVDSADDMNHAPSSERFDYVSLDTEDSSLYGKRRKEIVAEMKKVSDSVDSMLKRKFKAQFRESMSIEDKMTLIRKIGNARLEQEVQTLYHLLSGRIDDAIQNNPYRYYPDSSEPFAVLVKRWIFSIAQKKNAPFPLEQISIVSPNGIARADLRQDNRLTGAAEGAIVAHSDYGMTLEINNDEGKTKLVDYLRLSHDTYCELPTEDEQGVWIDVTESSWRGPCFLNGETFVHPLLSSMNADTATILQRDENSVSVRWNNSGETARYKRCAKGIYLREDEKNTILFPLVNQDGATLVLVSKMKSSKFLRDSSYKSHTLKRLEITSKAIIITRDGSDSEEKYELADDGIYYGNSVTNNSQQISAKYPLTSIEWMFLKDTSTRNVRINQSGQTLSAEVFGKKRMAEVLNVKEDEVCVKWKSTNERETFRRMPCGGFVTTSFPVGTKLFSIVDYGERGTYANIPGSSGIFLKGGRYVRDIKTLEANNKKLRLNIHGEEATYVSDGKGIYVREDSPDGERCVRMFESPGKWRGYVGIRHKTATLLFSPGIGAQCDVMKKTDDSYTLSWGIKEKKQETFRKKPGTGVYVLDPP